MRGDQKGMKKNLLSADKRLNARTQYQSEELFKNRQSQAFSDKDTIRQSVLGPKPFTSVLEGSENIVINYRPLRPVVQNLNGSPIFEEEN